jgi:hypothetical protein
MPVKADCAMLSQFETFLSTIAARHPSLAVSFSYFWQLPVMEASFTLALIAIPVPIYYFHIVAKSVVLDENGTIFDDVRAALAHAKQLASDLRNNDEFSGGTVVVEDEDAGQLFEVPLAGLSS